MTTDITYATGGDYRWSSSTFKWSDAESYKKWREANLLVIELTIGEMISLSEDLGKKMNVKLPESFNVSDISSKALSLPLDESFSVTSDYHKSHVFVRNFQTAIFMIEAAKKSMDFKLDEVISVAENMASLVDFFRLFNEKMEYAECYVDGVNFLLGINETLAVGDKFEQAVSYVRQMYDSFGMTDEQVKQLETRIAESLIIAEEYQDPSEFNRKYAENMAVFEHDSRHFFGVAHEQLGLAERVVKSIALGISERLVTTETFSRKVTFYAKLVEQLSTAEGVGKSTVTDKLESFGIDEFHEKHIGRNIAESLGFMEAFARLAVYSLDIQEGLSVDDAIKKNVSLSLVELMGMYDQIVRNSGAVISDMIINGSSITESDFERLLDRAAPVGYEEFQSFITGDYEYSEALFKIAFNSKTTDLAAIDGLKVEVDLPDIFDSGNVTVTGGSFRVNFNRRFNVIPEVGVVLSGGAEFAIPDVIADISGFTVTLRKTDGSPTTGFVSWRAHGY